MPHRGSYMGPRGGGGYDMFPPFMRGGGYGRPARGGGRYHHHRAGSEDRYRAGSEDRYRAGSEDRYRAGGEDRCEARRGVTVGGEQEE